MRRRGVGDTHARDTTAAAGNGAPKPENLLSEKQWPGTWSNYHTGETPRSRSARRVVLAAFNSDSRASSASVAFTILDLRLFMNAPFRIMGWKDFR